MLGGNLADTVHRPLVHKMEVRSTWPLCPCDQRLTEDRKTRTMTESTLLQNITEQLAGMMFTQNDGEGGKGVDTSTAQNNDLPSVSSCKCSPMSPQGF